MNGIFGMENFRVQEGRGENGVFWENRGWRVLRLEFLNPVFDIGTMNIKIGVQKEWKFFRGSYARGRGNVRDMNYLLSGLVIGNRGPCAECWQGENTIQERVNREGEGIVGT